MDEKIGIYELALGGVMELYAFDEAQERVIGGVLFREGYLEELAGGLAHGAAGVDFSKAPEAVRDLFWVLCGYLDYRLRDPGYDIRADAVVDTLVSALGLVLRDPRAEGLEEAFARLETCRKLPQAEAGYLRRRIAGAKKAAA